MIIAQTKSIPSNTPEITALRGSFFIGGFNNGL